MIGDATRFRAYDAVNNRMVFYTLGDLFDSLVAAATMGSYSTPMVKRLLPVLATNRGISSQMLATGANDQHKEEIFEADIVDFEFKNPVDPDNQDSGRGVVQYSGEEAGFVIVVKNRILVPGQPPVIQQIKFADDEAWKLWIRGNIYQNPKLLQ